MSQGVKPMDSDNIMIMVVMVTAILTTGGVLILRPVARRLGTLLEAMTQERKRPSAAPELKQICELLSTIDTRLDQIEERQDFAEALISATEPKLLNVPAHLRAQERH
jgi:hypothetical protein